MQVKHVEKKKSGERFWDPCANAYSTIEDLPPDEQLSEGRGCTVLADESGRASQEVHRYKEELDLRSE